MGSATANYGTITADDDVATSQEGSGSSDAPVEPVTAPVPSQGSWPADTELLLVPGSNKIMLTVQRPLIRAVFHDTLDRTRAAMMFQNAFPNAYDTVEMITDSIIRAAETVNQATNIFNRLVMDSDYKSDMIRLVSHQYSNTMLLTVFSAPSAHSHFSQGGHGSLCCDHPGGVLSHWFKKVDQ
jgi:hypothetical protein